MTALEQLESASEVNAIGWTWFQFAQAPGWSNKPAEEMNALLTETWYQNMPNHGDLAKPRILDVMAALNRMRKSQFKVSDA